MKNIYDQTAIVPVFDFYLRGSAPPDFENSPPAPGYNLRTKRRL